MQLFHDITSSGDLERLTTSTTIQQIQAEGKLLKLYFTHFGIQKNDIVDLLLLSNFVEEVYVNKVTAENELKAEFAAAVSGTQTESRRCFWTH